jgi:hypothetical protein
LNLTVINHFTMKKALIFGFALVFLFGCKDKKEQIPTYLKLEGFDITEPGGPNWQKVNFLWLYVGEEFLGAYSPGAEVPILAEGKQNVTVFPGVTMNGQVETPEIYPFFKRYLQSVNLFPGETTVIKPTTEYTDDAIFSWGAESDLDGAAFYFENLDTYNDLNLVYEIDSAFAGKSAVMRVDTAHNLMDIATDWVAGLPLDGGRQVWLEMNYQCSAPLELYIRGRGNPLLGETVQGIYQFSPRKDWNKIYFNLTPFVTETTQEEYSIAFRLAVPVDFATLKYTALKATARFDNLRLVHF